MNVTEPVPEGCTDLKVTEILAVDNVHAYFMETASNLEAGTFFPRLFLTTLTGATDVLGKPSTVGTNITVPYPKPRGGM